MSNGKSRLLFVDMLLLTFMDDHALEFNLKKRERLQNHCGCVWIFALISDQTGADVLSLEFRREVRVGPTWVRTLALSVSRPRDTAIYHCCFQKQKLEVRTPYENHMDGEAPALPHTAAHIHNRSPPVIGVGIYYPDWPNPPLLAGAMRCTLKHLDSLNPKPKFVQANQLRSRL